MSDDQNRPDVDPVRGEEHTRRRVLIGGAAMLATAASIRVSGAARAQEASPPAP